MSKSKEKSSKPAKGGNAVEDLKREQKLQAIIMADSWSKTFRPVTWEKPKALLPLVNVPMLEYTLEFLAQSGVEEVYQQFFRFINFYIDFLYYFFILTFIRYLYFQFGIGKRFKIIL